MADNVAGMRTSMKDVSTHVAGVGTNMAEVSTRMVNMSQNMHHMTESFRVMNGQVGNMAYDVNRGTRAFSSPFGFMQNMMGFQ